jgi:nitrogen fixation protein NifQ
MEATQTETQSLTRDGRVWKPSYLLAIDPKTCIGCGRCFKVCGRDVMELQGLTEEGELVGLDDDEEGKRPRRLHRLRGLLARLQQEQPQKRIFLREKPMTPEKMYDYLRKANANTACDPFDGHVLACVFAAGVDECNAGGCFTDAVGIHGATLRSTIDRYFPGTLESLEAFELDVEPVVNEDERCLRELLWRFRTAASPLNSLMTYLVARRATRANHLWQDLGLVNRGELSMLMNRHFTVLALRNNQDMKWKKFFYRMICRDDGFSMCVAPSCAECSDFEHCFSEESGESLFARTQPICVVPGLISIESSVAQ